MLALELADAYAEQGNGAGGDADAHSARHRRLVFELNRSGRYLDMRRRLQDCLKSVARETLHRAPGATPEEDGALFSALYAHALDEMHGALNALRADEAPPAADAPKGGAEVARLEQLAAECEVTGDTKRAEALHLERYGAAPTPRYSRLARRPLFVRAPFAHMESMWVRKRVLCHTVQYLKRSPVCRLAGSNCADVWHAYGTFSARTGNLGRAEEAFRSAVALEPSRTASLLALACVLWHNGVHTDSAFIEDAITVRRCCIALTVLAPLALPAFAVAMPPCTIEASKAVLSRQDVVQVVDAASTQQSDPAVAWALRCMLYRASPNMPEQEIEVRNAAHHTQVLAERTRGDAAPSLQSQPFLQLEIQLLDLQLGDLAAAVHEHAAAYAGAEAVRVPLAMCEAQAAGLAGDMTRATDILTSAAQNAGARHWSIHKHEYWSRVGLRPSATWTPSSQCRPRLGRARQCARAARPSARQGRQRRGEPAGVRGRFAREPAGLPTRRLHSRRLCLPRAWRLRARRGRLWPGLHRAAVRGGVAGGRHGVHSPRPA